MCARLHHLAFFHDDDEIVIGDVGEPVCDGYHGPIGRDGIKGCTYLGFGMCIKCRGSFIKEEYAWVTQ